MQKHIKLLSPAEMSPCARAREICAILATAINRSYVANEPAESPVRLGFLPDQRVHTTPSQQEELS
jgi:hypothetical protein